MIKRLGIVLYWVTSVLAVIVVLVGFNSARSAGSFEIGTLLKALGLGLLIWLVGKGIRYVLSGR